MDANAVKVAIGSLFVMLILLYGSYKSWQRKEDAPISYLLKGWALVFVWFGLIFTAIFSYAAGNKILCYIAMGLAFLMIAVIFICVYIKDRLQSKDLVKNGKIVHNAKIVEIFISKIKKRNEEVTKYYGFKMTYEDESGEQFCYVNGIYLLGQIAYLLTTFKNNFTIKVKYGLCVIDTQEEIPSIEYTDEIFKDISFNNN